MNKTPKTIAPLIAPYSNIDELFSAFQKTAYANLAGGSSGLATAVMLASVAQKIHETWPKELTDGNAILVEPKHVKALAAAMPEHVRDGIIGTYLPLVSKLVAECATGRVICAALKGFAETILELWPEATSKNPRIQQMLDSLEKMIDEIEPEITAMNRMVDPEWNQGGGCDCPTCTLNRIMKRDKVKTQKIDMGDATLTVEHTSSPEGIVDNIIQKLTGSGGASIKTLKLDITKPETWEATLKASTIPPEGHAHVMSLLRKLQAEHKEKEIKDPIAEMMLHDGNAELATEKTATIELDNPHTWAPAVTGLDLPDEIKAKVLKRLMEMHAKKHGLTVPTAFKIKPSNPSNN